MTVFRLPSGTEFPDPGEADSDGLLAVGGNLSTERLLRAYELGIFPWYSAGEPVLWWSPDPRILLFPAEMHVSRSLSRTLARGTYEIRMDTAFDRVMARCSAKKRPGQRGTWITPPMRRAYGELHEQGIAHSVEAWQDGKLAGGLYGLSLGAAFFGESMFADAPDASKCAFVVLVRRLAGWGFDFVDCQVRTEHLLRFGAREIPRAEFLDLLRVSVKRSSRMGKWTLEVAAARAR